MSTIQILDKQTLSKNKYILEKIIYQQLDHDGKLYDTAGEVYFTPDTVSILLVDKIRERFLINRRFRMAAFLNASENGFLIETYSGIIKETESAEEAVYRLIDEESNCKISELCRIGEVYVSPENVTELLHLYIAEYSYPAEGHEIEFHKNGTASRHLLEISCEDAREQIKSGKIVDAKTRLLLQYYFLFY